MEQTIEEQIYAVEIFGSCAKAQVLSQRAPAATTHFQYPQV